MITLNYNIKKINAGGMDLYAVNFRSCLAIGCRVYSTLQETLKFLSEFEDFFEFKYDNTLNYSSIFISNDYKYYSMLEDRNIGCNYKNAGGPF